MYYRYERERMKAIWSEDNAFDLWLRVEIAASVAWAELGVVSAGGRGQDSRGRVRPGPL